MVSSSQRRLGFSRSQLGLCSAHTDTFLREQGTRLELRLMRELRGEAFFSSVGAPLSRAMVAILIFLTGYSARRILELLVCSRRIRSLALSRKQMRFKIATLGGEMKYEIFESCLPGLDGSNSMPWKQFVLLQICDGLMVTDRYTCACDLTCFELQIDAAILQSVHARPIIYCIACLHLKQKNGDQTRGDRIISSMIEVIAF